ncbi:hypothetical protein BU15DRAFT_63863 [Melanogaster broomeanus]|nr:hypothetical protein BU15DRAFT_63863 [Melanogaster broomeanus]
MQRLRQRAHVEVDEEFVHDKGDADLAWGVTEHYLDYCLFVSGKKGLHAILPTSTRDPSYSFTLDLQHPRKLWKARHADVGFDPAGQMLFIGTYHQEDVWLAMVLWSFTQEDMLDDEERIHDEEANMADIHIRDQTPEDLTIMNMKRVTNLMTRKCASGAFAAYSGKFNVKHEMTYNQVKKLHDVLETAYDGYVEEVQAEGGEAWQDAFLTDNVPITLSVRYGQNQNVCQCGSKEEEATHWQRIHSYGGIRTMSIALATHIKCVPVDHWEEISVDEITREHGEEIYDSALRTERERVELDTYPLLNERGSEQQVYDEAGFRIPRRKAIIGGDVTMTGMLFALRNIHELFHRDQDNMTLEEADMPVTPHYIYPIGCLKQTGQFQAHGLFSCFSTQLQTINRALICNDAGEEEDDDEEEIASALFQGHRACVRGIASQGYNVFVHRVRSQARFHDVQRGMMTVASTGTHMQRVTRSFKARRFYEECKDALPFERYHEKIAPGTYDQALQVENVTDTEMGASHQDLRHIFEHIVWPLTRMWAHPHVLEQVKEHVVIFKQDILPSIVEWTTFGLCSVLKKIWTQFSSNMEQWLPIPQYFIELTSALERTLNYAHTGNSKVLTKGLMDPLWLSQGLLYDGLPSLSPLVKTGTLGDIRIEEMDWPVTSKSYPQMSSQRSILINYGQELLQVYEATFNINHSMKVVPVTFLPSHTDPTQRLLLHIVHRRFEVYEEDVCTLVNTQVRSSVQKLIDGDDVVTRNIGRERLTALETWFRQPQPLSYNNDSYANLVKAIVDNPDHLGRGLPASHLGQKSTTWFADHILQSVASKTIRCLPPFLHGGSGLAIMRIVIPALRRILSQGTDTVGDHTAAIRVLLVQVASQHQILNIPWAPNPTGLTGRPATTVVHNMWINLGHASSAGSQSLAPVLRPADMRHHAVLSAATSMQSMDSRAPWSAFNISIQDLNTILNHEVLPEEWTMDIMTFPDDDSYVKETYQWVHDNYNGCKPIHQLAMCVAIMFCHVLPNVMHGKKPSSLTSSSSQANATLIVCNTPWSAPSANKRGMAQQNIFLVMMSTFIIAMYEPESPLRRYLKDHAGALGALWTDKHGAKGIKPFNLVRLGLATAKGCSIFHSPKFNNGWSLLTSSAVTKVHGDLIRGLKDLPYGPYDAAVFLSGRELADTFRKCAMGAFISTLVYLNIIVTIFALHETGKYG